MSRLDELFTNLNQSPVEYQLEDVMAHLDKAVATTSGSSALIKWMLNKKFTIMLSLIGCTALGIALVLNTGDNPTEKNLSSIEMSNIEPSPNKNSPILKLMSTETSRSIKEDLVRDEFLLEIELLPLKKLKPKRTEIASTTFQPYMVYDPQEDDFIPTLTAEQRSANEKQKQKMLKSLGKRDKNWSYVPSGSVTIFGKITSVNKFYMQTTEVSNLEYRTFLFDLIIQGRKEDFLKARPDQEKWSALEADTNRTMEKTYFSHEAYNDYPVVNISVEGAKMYCDWLYKSYTASDFVKKYGKIEPIRIPYHQEWYMAAIHKGSGAKFPWGTNSTTNADSCYLANYMPKPGRYFDDGGFHTVKVTSYIPNEFGFYNIVGNVTEMVITDEGIQRAGGSWMSPQEDLELDNPKHLQKREGCHPADGFRVVFTHVNQRLVFKPAE